MVSNVAYDCNTTMPVGYISASTPATCQLEDLKECLFVSTCFDKGCLFLLQQFEVETKQILDNMAGADQKIEMERKRQEDLIKQKREQRARERQNAK